MTSFFNPVALLLLLAAQSIAGAVIDVPEHITTSHITTVTIGGQEPHKCYTKTIATPNYGKECPDLSTCPNAPLCINYATTTVSVPAHDRSCPTTPTATTPGPCQTCQTGCRTDTTTAWVTGRETVGGKVNKIWPSGPTLASGPRRRATGPAVPAPDCSTTIFRSPTKGGSGPTLTYHPLTETRISLVACGGCSLVVSELQGGVGPQITRTATVTDPAPAVFTTFACQ